MLTQHFYFDCKTTPEVQINRFKTSKENPFFGHKHVTEDVMNMMLEYNEIDNYNPRAQARLAKYAEFM